MSVAERELTDQFAGFGDREVFVPPSENEDIKLSRFLFTAASLITPNIARERPHMRAGGLNVYNPCLSMSLDFIRRGRLVPLLISQHMPIPEEERNTDDSSYFTVKPSDEDLRWNGRGPLEAGGMVSRLAYPGQQIAHILEGSANIDASGRRLGIVEIGTLKGHDYKPVRFSEGFVADKDLWQIQKEIFPNYPVLPYALRPFTQLVKTAIDTNRGDIRAIAEEMLPSCIQFESWSIRSIEQAHQNMAQAAVKGYASPYEDTDLIVLEQLEMDRKDEHYQRAAQQAARDAQQAQPLDAAALLNAVRQGSAEDRQAFQTMLMEVIRELKSEPVAAPAPVAVAPIVEAPAKATTPEKPKSR